MSTDGEKAQDHGRHIKVEYEPNDVKFWFSQIEGEMIMASVKSQWLKRTILQRNLPNKQKEDVKTFLSLTQAEAGDTIYKDIKNELMRIYGAKPQDSYKSALQLTMTGLPSQLGYQIVDRVCKKGKKLESCCCAEAVNALWSLQIPVNIRAHVSNMEFTHQTYKEVFNAADKVYLSGRQVSIAAVATPQASDPLNETQPAFTQQNQPQVAAVRGARSGTGGGGRGGRNNKRGGKNGGNQGNTSKPRGPRHASSPPEDCCDRHYRHGAGAWYCTQPLTCPWASKVAAKTS